MRRKNIDGMEGKGEKNEKGFVREMEDKSATEKRKRYRGEEELESEEEGKTCSMRRTEIRGRRRYEEPEVGREGGRK
jgi:hypothetical protein